MPDASLQPARDLARIYRALVKASWATVLEYRAQVLLWIVSWLFPLIMMAVWLAVVDQVGPTAGWNKSDFISYYVAATVVNYLTQAWIVYDWDNDIRKGDLSVKLLKLLDPFHYHLTNQLGWKLFFLAFVVPVVAVVVWLVPTIRYSSSPATWAAAIVSVVAGLMLNMLMSSAFAMLAFWTTQARNLYLLWAGAGQFLSGWIAPLPLFPGGFRQVADLLPFRISLGFPVQALMGQLSWAEIVSGLALAAAWSIFFLVAYRLLWRMGLRRYEAVGA